MRIATPSPWWTLTSYSLSVLIGAPEINISGKPFDPRLIAKYQRRFPGARRNLR
jgi:hypothetical protein